MAEIHSEWPPGPGSSGANEQLPEEGLEPTRTYAQALLRRPRLPFRHSGVPVIVSNASNARIARTSQSLVWHYSATREGRRPERGSRRPAGRGASISRVRSLGTYQACFRLITRTTIATWWAG